jgi:hypothetical protein
MQINPLLFASRAYGQHAKFSRSLFVASPPFRLPLLVCKYGDVVFNGDDLAALAKRERMAALVRRKMPAAPGGTPKWLLDVSIMTWCSKERKMVDEPYHSMPKDSVKTYLKEQMKKAADDSLKIVFVTI